MRMWVWDRFNMGKQDWKRKYAIVKDRGVKVGGKKIEMYSETLEKKCPVASSNKATWRKRPGNGKLPPGPWSLPILGNALQLKTKDLIRTLNKLHEKYGPVFTLYFGSERVVMLHGYQAVKKALIDRGDEFVSRGKVPVIDKLFKGLGVIFSNGEQWKQLRRFALTTLRNFGMGKKSIEERIQEEAQCLVEKLSSTQKMPFDPTFLLSCTVSNVICSIVFGNRYDYEDKKFLALLDKMDDNIHLLNSQWGQFYQLFPSLMDVFPGPYNQIAINFAAVKEFISEELKKHEETLDPTSPRDFIDCFLIKMEQEKQNGKTEFHVENSVMTTLDLFSGGTETTSTTLRYGLLILLKYPDIQEKVQEEIDHVIGRMRSPCIADRSQMPYTDAVVHEIQRFIALVPLGLPRAVSQDTPFGQYLIPKGTTVYPILSSVLHDSNEFPNPEQFNPGHFLNENGTFRKSSFFMPFSAGKRICLGEGLARMEIFLFLTTILQNFTLKPFTDPKEIDISPALSGLMNLPRPYQLCVLPRECTAAENQEFVQNPPQGIVFSNGERWKQLRQFALTTLRNFGMGKRSIEMQIQEEAQYLVKKLSSTQKMPFEPTFLLSCAVSNIICSIIFGKHRDYEDRKFLTLMGLMNDIFHVVSSHWGQLYQLFPSLMNVLPGPHKRMFKNVDELKKFISEEVKKHQDSLDPSSPQDLIDCFLTKMEQDKHNDKSEFYLENLVTTTFDLFIAGTESTSTTLRYGLLILLKYPEIQEKVQKEIDFVIGRTQSVCMANRSQMPYTDAVVHEIQRFIAVIPLGLPRTVSQDTPFRQYIIPKGTTIYPILSSVLHDSKEFRDPEQFNPEHFLNENGTFRKSNFFMPFSAGKRICLGESLARMEIFLILVTILQNFTLKPLIDPKEIDISPEKSGVSNTPKPYQLCALPR
ncbi:cytochrome P450 2E1 precursor isoform B [Alligator mississippiensis]|uniref:unspecific monooxygenase n=1 Tax=Alligator mississippiensis TaxID=8496 RepID=A0A151PGN6_ALLMI|nr:cytochrome P450 2E1 precursor isoform B [Alligator mississippiensis]